MLSILVSLGVVIEALPSMPSPVVRVRRLRRSLVSLSKEMSMIGFAERWAKLRIRSPMVGEAMIGGLLGGVSGYGWSCEDNDVCRGTDKSADGLDVRGPRFLLGIPASGGEDKVREM